MNSQCDAIEFEEPETSICDCCGATTTRLSRSVYRGDEHLCCYNAMFSTGPEHFFIDAIVVFGPWGEGTSKLDRLAFHFRWWSVQSVPTLMLVDETASPYRGQPVATPLDRAAALAHPLKQELFDLTDHILRCDEPIARFLAENNLDHPP